MNKPRVLILGLDGVGLDLIDQFASEGLLPNLTHLRENGAWGELRSTVPPTTLPAWTSFLTGTPPSYHGVPDFTIRRDYSVQFVGARNRVLPTIFRHFEDHELTTGAAWFPATYPPERLRGYQIAGWDSPVTAKGDRSFVFPRDLHYELEWQFGGDHLVFDAIDEFSDHAFWYRWAAISLKESIERRLKIALWLLSNRPVDVAAFYFGEADTAAHHFWAFHDAMSPRRPAAFEPALAKVLRQIYAALDHAVGELVQASGPGTAVVILSDHGSGGASDIALHLNRMLEEAGLLAFSSNRSASLGAKWIRNAIPAFIPSGLRRAAFRFAGSLAPSVAESIVRFGGIDWSRTRVFSEELTYAPSLWINQRGREPGGIVAEGEHDEIERVVRGAAAKVTSPNGSPLIKGVIPREKLHQGPLAHLFPDFILELERPDGYTPACVPSGGQRGEVVTRLAGKELLGRKGRSLPGCHTPQGVLIVSGDKVERGEVQGTGLEQVAPMLCALAEVPAASWFVTLPPAQLPQPALVMKIASEESASAKAIPAEGYSIGEERIVAERLRRLGYLE